MPRAGALQLADYPHEDVRLECRCGRKALYRRAELAKRVGLDALLPTLLLQIAKRVGCPIAAKTLAGKPVPGFEQCQMHFPDLMVRKERRDPVPGDGRTEVRKEKGGRSRLR